MLLIALMADKALGQPIVRKQRGRLELGAADAFDLVVKAVSIRPDGERSVLDRPDRAAMI
jgi:hypothetical protein